MKMNSPAVTSDRMDSATWPIRDAYDCECQVVDPDRAPDNVESAAKAPLPRPIADDDDRMCARCTVLLRKEKAPQHRADTEHLEIVSDLQFARRLEPESRQPLLDLVLPIRPIRHVRFR